MQQDKNIKTFFYQVFFIILYRVYTISNMNIDVVMTIVLLVMVVVIVAIVMYSMQDYISSVDDKVNDLKQGYVPLKKHAKDIDESRKEDAVLHDRINYTNEKINKSFDGNYDNLKNKPKLFDGDYTKLRNKPSDTGDYNKLINKPRLFDGEYGSLKNKPDLFDGDYNKLENKPALFDGNYDNLTNVPTAFASNWSNIDDKPSKFPSSWDMIDGKPSNFANTWNNINEKPDHYPSRWDMIDDKPTFANSWDDIEDKPTTYDSTWDKVQDKPTTYDSTWDKVQDKPQQFPTSWDMIAGKPVDLGAPTGPAEYDDTELRGMINGKAAIAHTHTMYDIQGIDSNLSSMLTDYLSGYALSGHQHSYESITGLSEYLDSNLNTKSAIGHRHDASDINNLQSVIDSNLPNLSGYATTSELTSGLNTKQNTLTAGDNITISGNTISAIQPDVSGYATSTEVTTGLAGKQGTITGAITTVIDTDLDANKVIVSNESGKIQGSSISTSILNFLSGLTGNVQTQINNKQDKLTTAQTDALTELASGGGATQFKGYITGNFYTNVSLTLPSDITTFELSSGEKYILLYFWSNYNVTGTLMIIFTNSSSTSPSKIRIIDTSFGGNRIFTDTGNSIVGYMNNYLFYSIKYNPSNRTFTRDSAMIYNAEMEYYYY
jgi:hypothetical protein